MSFTPKTWLDDPEVTAPPAPGTTPLNAEALVDLETRLSSYADTELASAIAPLANKMNKSASSTDNAIVRYDGTSGKAVQDSSVIVGDDGSVQAKETLTVRSTTGPAQLVLDGVTSSGVTFNYNGNPIGFFASSAAQVGLYNTAGKLALSINSNTNAVVAGNNTGTLVSNAIAPAVDDATNKIATTAWYAGQQGTAAPLAPGTATAGTSKRFAPIDHVHPQGDVILTAPNGGKWKLTVANDGTLSTTAV